MKKQITGTLAATAALLAIAGIAQAAPAELNIYGASAQYNFWSAQGATYATAAAGLGCKNATAAAEYKDASGVKHGLVVATDCSSTLVPVNSATSKRDINIRYSGIASTEGILAIKKLDPIDATLAAGCNTLNGERLMYNDSTTTVCKPVHVGTSDVAGESLVQVSDGQKFGPLGGGSFPVDLGTYNLSTSSLTPANTIIVPFGFFANKGVTASQCTTGLVGNYCTTNAHCKHNDGTAGVCGAASTISNISREEASLIFSGYVSNWSDLGAYFTTKPIVACLRHAGSGTHAALDLTVMNSGWGANVVGAEVPGSIWFNQGSTDEVKCINGNSTATPTGDATVGAIGYLDADAGTGKSGESNNVVPLKYNGHYGTRTAIRNGQYEFYTDGQFYTNPANTALVNNIAANMVTFSSSAANVPSSKANYYAAVSEMKYNRSAEAAYPAFVGASEPMLP